MKKTFAVCLQRMLFIPALLAGLLLPPLKVQASEGEGISPVTKKRVYLVRPGECLSAIAMEVYGSGEYWVQIYENNKNLIGENPDYLQAGVYLELPEAPERGLMWETIYEQKPEEYEFASYEAYISPDAPYQIEECYYYRNPEDETYGKWEQDAGRYNVCYPRLISLNGRNMTDINETIRKYAMLLAEEYYIDPEGTTAEVLSGGIFRDEYYLRSTERYQITYLDENLISIVFEHYSNNGNLIQLLEESHRLESLVIDLETGHVYACDEIFKNTKELAEEEYARILEKYSADEETYDFFRLVGTDPMENTLNEDGWQESKWKTSVFLDGEKVRLAFNYNVSVKAATGNMPELWKGYQVTDFTPEEIASYQTDSSLWGKWRMP